MHLAVSCTLVLTYVQLVLPFGCIVNVSIATSVPLAAVNCCAISTSEGCACALLSAVLIGFASLMHYVLTALTKYWSYFIFVNTAVDINSNAKSVALIKEHWVATQSVTYWALAPFSIFSKLKLSARFVWKRSSTYGLAPLPMLLKSADLQPSDSVNFCAISCFTTLVLSQGSINSILHFCLVVLKLPSQT